jgi:hypothetical protein
MKSLFLAAWLLFAGYVAAAADSRPLVVLHATAAVSGDSFCLSDIATVTSTNTSLRAKLMSVPMGRAPLAGLTRQFNEGDVSLKLRQAGIDPETLAISGPSQIVVLGSSVAMPNLPVSIAAQPAAAPQSQASPAQPKSIVIHRGDKVTLEYDGDGLAITADVVASMDGAIGDTISLSRDGAAHSLTGIVQDAQTVKMME